MRASTHTGNYNVVDQNNSSTKGAMSLELNAPTKSSLTSALRTVSELRLPSQSLDSVNSLVVSNSFPTKEKDSYESSELSDLGDDESEAETDKMDFLDDDASTGQGDKVSDLRRISHLTELARLQGVDSDESDDSDHSKNPQTLRNFETGAHGDIVNTTIFESFRTDMSDTEEADPLKRPRTIESSDLSNESSKRLHLGKPHSSDSDRKLECSSVLDALETPNSLGPDYRHTLKEPLDSNLNMGPADTLDSKDHSKMTNGNASFESEHGEVNTKPKEESRSQISVGIVTVSVEDNFREPNLEEIDQVEAEEAPEDESGRVPINQKIDPVSGQADQENEENPENETKEEKEEEVKEESCMKDDPKNVEDQSKVSESSSPNEKDQLFPNSNSERKIVHISGRSQSEDEEDADEEEGAEAAEEKSESGGEENNLEDAEEQVEEEEDEEVGKEDQNDAVGEVDLNLDERRKQAISELVSIEKDFSHLRDKLYNDKLSLLEHEMELCLKGLHPELLRICYKVNDFYQQNIMISNSTLKYNLQCINSETIATRSGIHQDFMKNLTDMKNEMVAETTSLWYKINRERNCLDQLVPDYSYAALPLLNSDSINIALAARGSMDYYQDAPCMSKKAMTQSTIFELVLRRNYLNEQLGVLNGLKEFYGFPCAVASSLVGDDDSSVEELLLRKATPEEVVEDLQAMGIIQI